MPEELTEAEREELAYQRHKRMQERYKAEQEQEAQRAKDAEELERLRGEREAAELDRDHEPDDHEPELDK